MSRKLGLRNYRGQYIDTANPVNRQHPLNRGRVAWWLGLPGKTGGNQFYDLMGLNPGTLTSMGNSSNGWRNSNYPGALGPSILTDGSAGYVISNVTAVTGYPFTMSCWFNLTTNSGGVMTPMVFQIPGSNQFMARIILRGDLGGKNIQAQMQVGGNNGIASSATAFVVGQWFYATAIFLSASSRTIYVNGLNPASDSTNVVTFPALNTMRFGAVDDSGHPERFAGLGNSYSLWNRALSVAEVYEDYILSQQGYPGVINRVTSMLPDLYNQPGGGSSIVFRKSLAQYGTRVGTRQMQGAR